MSFNYEKSQDSSPLFLFLIFLNSIFTWGKKKQKNFGYMHITRKLLKFSVDWSLNFMNWQSTATQVSPLTMQHMPHLKPCMASRVLPRYTVVGHRTTPWHYYSRDGVIGLNCFCGSTMSVQDVCILFGLWQSCVMQTAEDITAPGCLPCPLPDIAIPEPGMSDPIMNHNTTRLKSAAAGWQKDQISIPQG